MEAACSRPARRARSRGDDTVQQPPQQRLVWPVWLVCGAEASAQARPPRPGRSSSRAPTPVWHPHAPRDRVVGSSGTLSRDVARLAGGGLTHTNTRSGSEGPLCQRRCFLRKHVLVAPAAGLAGRLETVEVSRVKALLVRQRAQPCEDLPASSARASFSVGRRYIETLAQQRYAETLARSTYISSTACEALRQASAGH